MKIVNFFFAVSVFFISENLFAYTNYAYTGYCEFVSYSKEFQSCLDNEFVEYDRILNITYKLISKQHPTFGLRSVEDAWVKFKESDCEYMARAVNRGKFYPFIQKACWISKTKARITDLRREYNQGGWFRIKD